MGKKMNVSEATAVELDMTTGAAEEHLGPTVRQWDPELDLVDAELPVLDPIQGTGSAEFRNFVKQHGLDPVQERILVRYLERKRGK